MTDSTSKSAEACEMAQPWPLKAASVIFPSLLHADRCEYGLRTAGFRLQMKYRGGSTPLDKAGPYRSTINSR